MQLAGQEALPAGIPEILTMIIPENAPSLLQIKNGPDLS